MHNYTFYFNCYNDMFV